MMVMQLAELRGISMTDMLETPAWEFPYWEAYFDIKAKEAEKHRK